MGELYLAQIAQSSARLHLRRLPAFLDSTAEAAGGLQCSAVSTTHFSCIFWILGISWLSVDRGVLVTRRDHIRRD